MYNSVQRKQIVDWLKKYNLPESLQYVIQQIPKEETDEETKSVFMTDFFVAPEELGNRHISVEDEQKLVEWLKLTQKLFNYY